VACPQEHSSKAKVGLGYNDVLEDSLSRPEDYKLRCTLTTGVSQILQFTRLLSQIKVYWIQRSFIPLKGLLPQYLFNFHLINFESNSSRPHAAT
jgi:hypothetical protein